MIGSKKGDADRFLDGESEPKNGPRPLFLPLWAFVYEVRRVRCNDMEGQRMIKQKAWVLLLTFGCNAPNGNLSTIRNSSSFEYRGLQATIQDLSWSGDGSISFLYRLDQVKSYCPWELKWDESVFVSYLDNEGRPIFFDVYGDIGIQQDFLVKKKHFASRIEVAVPANAVKISTSLSRTKLVTNWIELPKK
jgi:hypothetical protein